MRLTRATRRVEPVRTRDLCYDDRTDRAPYSARQPGLSDLPGFCRQVATCSQQQLQHKCGGRARHCSAGVPRSWAGRCADAVAPAKGTQEESNLYRRYRDLLLTTPFPLSKIIFGSQSSSSSQAKWLAWHSGPLRWCPRLSVYFPWWGVEAPITHKPAGHCQVFSYPPNRACELSRP